jgi:putative AlgH/UPF0301 family transcriptional regulator
MSVNKLCFFTTLAAIVAFSMPGRLDRQVKELDLPQPTPLHGSRLVADRTSGCVSGPTTQLVRSHWANALGAQSEMLPVVYLPIQTKNAKGLGAGKLLVASRDLGDPHFAQTVILLVRYDTQGVVGLILNRRTNLPLSRALENFKPAKDRSDPVYLGGPVETPSVLALLQSPAKIEGAEHIFGAVYMISAKPLFEEIISKRPDPGVFHVYLGYAGWTNAQLRREVQLGAWFIFPADAASVFDADPDSLWEQMIRKTELTLAGNKPVESNRRAPADPLVEASLRNQRFP